jgi:hypothetical protein
MALESQLQLALDNAFAGNPPEMVESMPNKLTPETTLQILSDMYTA